MDAPRQEDPVLRHSRREALLIMAVWAATMAWSVPYCYIRGYRENRAPEEVTLVGGMVPDWVFWGVLVPWAACFVISIWFSVFYMKEDELGGEALSDGD